VRSSGGAAVHGGRTGTALDRLVRRSVYAMAGLLTGAVVLLEIAFVRNDFHFALVADHSRRPRPPSTS